MRAGEHPRQIGADDVSADQHEQPRGEVFAVMRRRAPTVAQPLQQKIHPGGTGKILRAAGRPPLLPGVSRKACQPAQQFGHPASTPGSGAVDRRTNGGAVNRRSVSSNGCAVCGHHGSATRAGKRARNSLLRTWACSAVAFGTSNGLRVTCLTRAVTTTAQRGRPCRVVARRRRRRHRLVALVGLTCVMGQHPGHDLVLVRRQIHLRGGQMKCPSTHCTSANVNSGSRTMRAAALCRRS